MSYCVNCGVQLNKNVQKCPLCGVEVINPIEPIDPTVEKRYPQEKDVPRINFDRGLWIKIVSTGIAVPVLLSIVMDYIFGKGTGWSLYVAGGLGMIWAWMVSPFLFRKQSPARPIVIDIAAILGFLFLIENVSHTQGWFFPLALPITGSFTILLLILVTTVRHNKVIELYIVASIFLFIGILCVLMNGIINFYIQHYISLDWSLLVLIPFVGLAVIAIFLQQRQWIVEELKHWFHI